MKTADIDKHIHYLEVLKENYSPFQKELRDAVDFAIENLRKHAEPEPPLNIEPGMVFRSNWGKLCSLVKCFSSSGDTHWRILFEDIHEYPYIYSHESLLLAIRDWTHLPHARLRIVMEGE